jgi:hypothetical protein
LPGFSFAGKRVSFAPFAERQQYQADEMITRLNEFT